MVEVVVRVVKKKKTTCLSSRVRKLELFGIYAKD